MLDSNPFLPGSSRVAYALSAWPVATLPALALAWIVELVAPGYGLRRPESTLSAGMTAWVVVVAPMLETALLMVALYVLRRLFSGAEKLQALLLAALGAVAHSIDDSWFRAIWAFWPFCVYSVALISWRKRSLRDAFVVATSIHALHNASVVAIAALVVGYSAR